MSLSTASSATGSSAGAFSVDGIVSGLNTTQIVDQLMQIEARPKLFTQQRLNGFSQEKTALAAVVTKLATAKDNAQTVSSLLNWQALKATSSDTNTVDATATTGSGLGTLTFTVDSLANPDTYTSNWTTANTTDVVVPADGSGKHSLTVGVGTDSRTIDVGDGTLDSVVSAINSQTDFKMTASAVQVANGSYRLQFTTVGGGAANTISFNPASFTAGGTGWLHVSTAADAQITIGSGANAYSVKADTNVMANVLPGVTMTLKQKTAAGSTVTVSSARDGDSAAANVQKLVDSLNSAITEIANQSKYDTNTKVAGPLLDNPAVRQVRQMIAQAVSGSSGSTNAFLAGISLNADGTVAFDKSKFTDSFAKDPVGTQALFTDGPSPGFGKRLYDAIDQATAADTGLLTSSQTSVQNTIDALQLSIDGMQQRLDQRQVALRAQFTAMETTLGKLKNQSGWLQGQLTQLANGG
jgi:flagellar hook-associated protein 2